MDMPPPKAPDGFTPPEPQPLALPEDADIGALISGSIALALRFGNGVFVHGWTPGFAAAKDGEYSILGFRDSSPALAACKKPTSPVIIYEYEPSPFCRKVREAATMLDLEVTYKPCPGARKGFAQELGELGGKMQVPYLVDPNTGTSMYESDDIVDYLFDTYGPGSDAVPWTLRGGFAMWTTSFASLARGMAGSKLDPRARPDAASLEPIVLWGYEASPFVKIVRERLVELALPHTVINCGRGSANRDRQVQKTGKQFQVPFLCDPNTGVEMFESTEIVKYLDNVYLTEA